MSGEDTKSIEEDVPLSFVETDGVKPNSVWYLCDGLTTWVAMPDILVIDIADTPETLPELVEGKEKEDYEKRI